MEDGTEKESKLLVSGWWGVGRKMGYTFDLLTAFSWSAMAGFGSGGVFPHLYFPFLTILLIHRIHRDEAKCRMKYGESWRKYSSLVRYRLIPGIY
jgi:protein-S-isoprenylcysteine O-methyltransferase Ste14